MASCETSEEDEARPCEASYLYETASVATLRWACAGCHVGITHYLLDVCQIDPDACDDTGLTPLMLASMHGHTDIIKLLLHRNADVNKTDTTGCTALHHAVRHNHVRVADILITHGDTRLNVVEYVTGETPLCYAALRGNLAIARSLVEHGCTLDVQNNEGDTALHVACREEWDEVALLLVRNGASTKLRNKSNMTPVYVASTYLRRILESHMKLVEVEREG